MAAPLDVCIRGAGMVGRTLALLLARDRLRVGLVDTPPAAPPPQPDVRAYALNTASRDLLLRLRAWPDEQHATPVRAMDVRGDDGGRVRFTATDEGVEALAWIVDVEPLLARLAEAVRFQPQVELLPQPRPPLDALTEPPCSVTRCFASASPRPSPPEPSERTRSCTNMSKIVGNRSSGMPMPLSFTVTNAPSSAIPHATSIRPFGCV